MPIKSHLSHYDEDNNEHRPQTSCLYGLLRGRCSSQPLCFSRPGPRLSLSLCELRLHVEQWKRNLHLTRVKNGSTNKTRAQISHAWLPLAESESWRVLFNLQRRCWSTTHIIYNRKHEICSLLNLSPSLLCPASCFCSGYCFINVFTKCAWVNSSPLTPPNMLFLFSAIRVIRIFVPVCAAVFL